MTTSQIPAYKIQGDEASFTMTLTGQADSGSFTCIRLQPGVHLAFNEIKSDYWPTFEQPSEQKDFLIINICLDGRCETALSDGKYAVVSAGQMAIGTQQPQSVFFYPTSFYIGIELLIDLNLVKESTGEDYLAQSGIHMDKLLENFQCGDQLFLRNAPENIRNAARKLWDNRHVHDDGTLRLYAASLLHILQTTDPAPEPVAWFTKTQLTIAKDAEKRLSENLSIRVTAKEIADQYGISETSFKNYFKGVFGEGFLPYFRRKRMELAADLLIHSDQKVIDIAAQTGYENQGKFAGVFKSYYGMTPLEYRRRQRLQEHVPQS